MKKTDSLPPSGKTSAIIFNLTYNVKNSLSYNSSNAFFFVFLNSDSLHARYCETWSYKKKKGKKIKAYRKFVSKEPTGVC